MGIPRLLNYLINRYPNLSTITKANKLPQYDHLYIDMNFVIHNMVPSLECDTNDGRCEVETDIFDRILTAIETLFRLIRPKKLLFLSIDGVSPRAKWNKQRQRRFLAAAKQSVSFDSNCISPGTEFMQRLDVIINEFIVAKVSQDKCWQNCRIVFSGSQTPGEGSHKIIEFMRQLKNSENYSKSLMHCIFSGDTDFLMLGLAVHEIYVSLLQNLRRRTDAEPTMLTDDLRHEFRLVHIESLREYIEMEFSSCGSLLSFKYNMDDLCDDFVLISMLIGNDFLPHLPNFHVNSNIMSILFDVYKRVLLILDGYINERGRLNVQRFNVFLNELKKSDFAIYKNHENVLRIKNTVQNTLIATVQNGNGFSDDVGGKQTDANHFPQVKTNYYEEKDVDFAEKGIRNHALDYVSTIQWVLSYYYTSNYSWNWYYPCNYAPFVSDFPDLSGWKIEFANDEPAMPLEHLLAVQPAKSSELLPPPIRALMQNDLKHFFPPEINFDLDGKFADWEAVPLLPFVEKDVFDESVDAVIDQLSKEESERNVHKPLIQYECLEYEDDVLVDRIELPFERFAQNPLKRIDRMATFDASVVNFSDLKYLPYATHLEKSSNPHLPERLMIEFIPLEEETQELEIIAKELLNTIVSIGWPRVHPARVVSISSSTKKITWCEETQAAKETSGTELPAEFARHVFTIQERANVQGIRLGQIDVVAHVALVQYEKFVPSKHTKEFVAENIFDGDFLVPVAGQTIVKDCIFSNNRSRLCARGQIKLGALVFLLGNQTYHGQRAYVMAKNSLDSTGRVATYVHMEDEPDFSDAIDMHNEYTKNINENIVYREPNAAAQSIGINAKFLARLSGSVLILQGKRDEEVRVPPRKTNIGLQLKPRNQTNALNAFVKCDANGWHYSQAAIDLVNEYLQQFPRLADVLDSSEIFVSDFAPNHLTEGKQYLNDITRWLAQHPKVLYARTQIAGKNLCDVVIEKLIASVNESKPNTKIVNLQVKWQNLFIPNMNNVFVIPDPIANYELFDRVIIVRSGYPVSIGAKGTVVAIQPAKQFQADVTERNLTSMDILMDEPYKRAISAVCDFKETRIFHVRTTTMLMNITYKKR